MKMSDNKVSSLKGLKVGVLRKALIRSVCP